MKGVFVLCLLGFLAVAYGRGTSLQTGSVAELGDNPWLVHLRIAVATSGYLNTCGGSIIDNRWVLTSAVCVTDSRFIWIRYGLVNVVNPELVTETSTAVVHPAYNANTLANNIALLSINRVVQPTPNIRPLPIEDLMATPDAGKVCGFGDGNNSEGAGEVLRCFDVTVEVDGSDLSASGTNGLSPSDFGGALVSDGVQYGILNSLGPNTGTFLRVGRYKIWLESVIGFSLGASKNPLDIVQVVN